MILQDEFDDEHWVDIRRIDILSPILLDRVEQCLLRGCDAIEFDNPDGFYHDSGFQNPFSYEQQLVFNRWLADTAHSYGMSVVLKNDIMQIHELKLTFDGAVNEQCWEDEECYLYWPFIDVNKPVFQTEYEVERCDYCARANEMGTSTIKKHPDLTPCRVDCSTPWHEENCILYQQSQNVCDIRQHEPADECPTDPEDDPICGTNGTGAGDEQSTDMENM